MTSIRQTYEAIPGTKGQWTYLDEHPGSGPRVGVSLSGGGIRSASFSLGALQRLIADGVFERIDHLAAVSGGTYLAGGFAITSKESNSKESNSKESNSKESDSKVLEDYPWGPGSPEERKLRHETTYLASGFRDSLWLVSNYLYGMTINLASLGIGAFLLGRLTGIFFSYIVSDEIVLDPKVASLVLLCSWLGPLSAIVLVGIRRVFDKPKRNLTDPQLILLRNTVTASWGITATAIFVMALPMLVAGLHPTLEKAIDLPLQTDIVWNRRVNRALVAAVAMTALAMIGGASIWAGRRTRRTWLFAPIAILAGPGLLMTPFVLAIDTALYHESHVWTQAPQLAIGALLLVGFAVMAHNRRYSLHLFYRERLQQSFGLVRSKPNPASTQDAQPVSYSKELKLSGLGDRTLEGTSKPLPNFIYCASVAADRSEAPYRRNAGSYTFEADWSGGPLVGYVDTSLLEGERGAGGTELTLPSIMAISGAAISPLMGRFSEPALRFLLAVLNLRMGVWLPHPQGVVKEDGEANTEEPERGEAPVVGATSGNPARDVGRSRRLLAYIWRGWKEPGAMYVLREATGLAKTGGRFVYVTDGGHWENLGLVELLRRRCTRIIVIDASAARHGVVEEIARAARLANAELGVTLSLDLSTLSDENEGEPEAPYARGKFTYPDGRVGELILIRSMLWEGAPFELKELQRTDSQFPHHPTSNQFFSGEQFDAYRQLGWSATGYVSSEFPIPPRFEYAGDKRRLQG